MLITHTGKDRFKGAKLRRAGLLLEALIVKRMTSMKASNTHAPVFQPPRNHCAWRRPG